MKSRLSKWIKHTVECENLGLTHSKQCIELFKELFLEVLKKLRKTSFVTSKNIFNEALKEIKKLITEYYEEIEESVYENILYDINYEKEFLEDFLKEEEKELKIPSNLFKSILFTSIIGYSSFKDVIVRSLDKLNRKVESMLKYSYLSKSDLAEFVDDLEKRLPEYEYNLDNDIRTVETSVFRNTDFSIFAANDIKVRYCAVLDSRSCIVCGSMHGEIFTVKNRPLLPIHDRCRCSYYPLLSEEQFEFNSFPEWLDSLPEKEQKDVLGKTRYELYKSGVQINSFIDNKTLIPIKKLLNK